MNNIENEYYKWLIGIVTKNRYDDKVTYNKLLKYLYNTDFTYTIPMDYNRLEDGLDMRWNFAYSTHTSDVNKCVNHPCSVLEMMIALAIRCEDVMYDPEYGDRTAQWFWRMISSLGLNGEYDSNYNEGYVRKVINRFLDREYKPNGEGGLFAVRGCREDLRKVEIWEQYCRFLDNMI